MLSHQSTFRKSIWLAWVLLSAGLIATTVAAIYMKMDVEPDFNVKPEGDREIYTSIIYLELFSGRNSRAFVLSLKKGQ